MKKRQPHQFPWRETPSAFSLGRRAGRGCKPPFGGHRHERAKARRVRQRERDETNAEARQRARAKANAKARAGRGAQLRWRMVRWATP